MKTGSRIAALLSVVALGIASCSSSTEGKGRVSSPAKRSAVTPATCAADYCDDFSDPGSGWPSEDGENVTAGYADGGYRVTGHHLVTVPESAPASITKYAKDHGVQLDVDVTTAGHFPVTAALGLACWLHPAEDGRGTAGFTFLLSKSQATIGLWDETDGTYHELADEDAFGVLDDGRRTHLTAQCLHSGDEADGARVDLTLAVDGRKLLAATYAEGGNLQPWGFGDKAGVLIHGRSATAVFDDFALTSKCRTGC